MMSRLAAGIVALASSLPAADAPPQAYFDAVPTNAVAMAKDATIAVEGVVAFSPADDAGFQQGDRVVGLDHLRTRSQAELYLVRDLLKARPRFTAQVLRGDRILTLTLRPSDEGARLGIDTWAPVLSGDRVAFEAFGIAPAEYLGPAQGGRDDGGALAALLASYTPTNPTHAHPVLNQFAAFPARAAAGLRALAAADRPGARAWVLGLMKTYYALVETRWEDARRHSADAGLRTARMEPFLDGLADFYGRLADDPPDAVRGVDLKRYGVTPEYFALCCPPPIPPFKACDWKSLSPAFAADFARRAEGLPWRADAYERAAQREFAVDRSTPTMDYLSLTRGALLYPEMYGGYPTRYSPLFRKDACAKIVADLQRMCGADARQRPLAALALITPSALRGDTNAYRQALLALRDAGSREVGLANAYTLETWLRHGRLPAFEAFEAIRREVDASLGVPGLYAWFAARSGLYAERLKRGWYYLKHDGLEDGSYLIRNLATVEALGGPAEVPAAR